MYSITLYSTFWFNYIYSFLSPSMHLRSAPFGSEISAVEILGGGVRMQVVQQAVIDCMGEVN